MPKYGKNYQKLVIFPKQIWNLLKLTEFGSQISQIAAVLLKFSVDPIRASTRFLMSGALVVEKLLIEKWIQQLLYIWNNLAPGLK